MADVYLAAVARRRRISAASADQLRYFVKRSLDPPPFGFGPDVELVGDGPDDGDPEPALVELLLRALEHVGSKPAPSSVTSTSIRSSASGTRPRRSRPALLVGVPDRVRAGLRERELEIGDDLLLQRPGAREPVEREPAERDVLRARRDREGDDAVAVLADSGPSLRSLVPA
jgi:hypothetical protein